MSETRWTIILAITAIVVVIAIAHAAHTFVTCNGDVVRGVVAFKCIEVAGDD